MKVDSVVAEVTHAGRLFQRRGAATPKARSPATDSRDLRMTSLLDEADCSRVLEHSSAWLGLEWLVELSRAGLSE